MQPDPQTDTLERTASRFAPADGARPPDGPVSMFPPLRRARAIVRAHEGGGRHLQDRHAAAIRRRSCLCRGTRREGHSIFLDVKLLDIDNTVMKGVENIARMGMRFVTIHAYPKAMRAAVAGLAAAGGDLCLLGVTVLTSMDEDDLHDAGYAGGVEDLVRVRAADARVSGMGGIVCSPHEVGVLREAVGPSLVTVTPGIRPAGSEAGDQKRIMTPGDAIRAGADYIVVARPVVRAPDPRAAAEAIVAEIDAAL